MPSCPRGDVVRLGEVALYHCWSRCVRRAFLCGRDDASGRDYEYRRDWIRGFEETLANLFGIEVGFHAELSNHLHLVLRTRPDVVASWSDEEVAHRWLKISHATKSRDGSVKPIKAVRIAMEVAIPGRIKVLRERLANPSFFMAALCEHLARRSNREDACRGRFWEDRFGSRELIDEASLLVCGIYIDLNQVRAGEANKPEDSTHTSAFDRIEALQLRGGASHPDQHSEQMAPDGWMCELTIDERAHPDCEAHLRSATLRRASDKGMLPIAIGDYLQLLDAVGRVIRDDKSGSIPSSLLPILQRVGLQSETWIDAVRNFQDWFGSFVGTSQAIAKRAQQSGKHWCRTLLVSCSETPRLKEVVA